MPDYKRFIAYFYEYIDGKRQRNAGFVKAELRGSVWRISMQLKGRRWPEESLEIYGYRVGKKRYPVTRLAKGYPLKDCLIQKFQLPESWVDGSGNHFEELEGMWIPCGEKRCFISHWGEGEAEPEKLGITEDREKKTENSFLSEKQENQPEISVASEKEENQPEVSVPPEKEENQSEVSDQAEKEENQPEVSDDSREPAELEATECQMGETISEASEEQLKEELSGETEPVLKKTSEAQAAMDAPKLRREPQECLDDMKRVLDSVGEKEEERPAMTEQENKEECPAMPEQEKEEDRPAVAEQEQEEECPAVTEQEQEEEQQEAEERKKNSGQDRVWEILKKHHPAICPLRNMEGECVAICPRDVLWLRQQGWPVGRNSFLIQGFSKYRHMLLCRRKDGSYILGVPGKENPQIQNIARAFGYGELEKSGQGEDFGYWCRKIL